MSIELPDLLDSFFAAENAGNLEALSACFAEHAVVLDEGRTMEGIPDIRRWMGDARAKYQHTVEPIAVSERDGRIVVTAKVTGNFPNSPLTLDHVFGVEADRISSLEIR